MLKNSISIILILSTFLSIKAQNSVKWIVNPEYEYIGNLNDGLIPVKENGKFGYIDIKGKNIIKCIFDDANEFSEGVASVKKGSRWGYIDKTGKMVIQYKYNNALLFCKGVAPVELNSKMFLINKYGNLVCEDPFENISNFSKDGIAKAKFGNTDGFIKTNGNFICSSFTNEKLYKDLLNTFKIEKGYSVPKYQSSDGKWGIVAFTLKFELEDKLGTWESYLCKNNIKKPEYKKEYLKKCIETSINKWQQKGEFETTKQWQERVNENTRKTKINEFINHYNNEYNNIIQSYNEKLKQLGVKYKKEYDCIVENYYKLKTNDLNLSTWNLMEYDADNQTYLIKSSNHGDILLPVPLNDAPSFKHDWSKIKNNVVPTYVPSGDDVVLVSLSFTDNNKTYVYDSKTNAKYAMTDINYNFSPIDLNLSKIEDINYEFDKIDILPPSTVVNSNPTELIANKSNIKHRSLNATFKSDVDTNIPINKDINDKTFVLIIANQDYQKVSKVDYALSDGKVFSEYCLNTLCIPEKHILSYYNVTLGNLIEAVNKIKAIGNAYNGDINLIIYYAGHGIPDESNKDAYILPIDGTGSSIRTCYKQSEFYSELSSTKAKSIIVFMDACFSGTNRNGDMLVAARGVAIKTKAAIPVGNMLVLSAAQGDETAYPFLEQQHGLFTYYLLKKLQTSKGDVTLGELINYVEEQVKRKSIIENGKSQTPSVNASFSVIDNWKNWRLK